MIRNFYLNKKGLFVLWLSEDICKNGFLSLKVYEAIFNSKQTLYNEILVPNFKALFIPFVFHPGFNRWTEIVRSTQNLTTIQNICTNWGLGHITHPQYNVIIRKFFGIYNLCKIMTIIVHKSLYIRSFTWEIKGVFFEETFGLMTITSLSLLGNYLVFTNWKRIGHFLNAEKSFIEILFVKY